VEFTMYGTTDVRLDKTSLATCPAAEFMTRSPAEPRLGLTGRIQHQLGHFYLQIYRLSIIIYRYFYQAGGDLKGQVPRDGDTARGLRDNHRLRWRAKSNRIQRNSKE